MKLKNLFYLIIGIIIVVIVFINNSKQTELYSKIQFSKIEKKEMEDFVNSFEDSYKKESVQFLLNAACYYSSNINRNDSLQTTMEIDDKDQITSEIIKYNVDLSFEALNNSKYCKGLSKKDFFQYILPYRISREKLENWRDSVKLKFPKLESQIKNTKKLEEVISLVNSKLANHIEFKQHSLPYQRSFSQIMNDGYANCSDLAFIAVTVLRSYGIPSGIDYLRYKSKKDSPGHAWAFALDTKTNKTIPFNPIFTNQIELESNYINAPKVYRVNFKSQFDDSKWYELSEYGKNRPYELDVTDQYVETEDIIFKTTKLSNPKIFIFYKGGWHTISGTKYDKSTGNYTAKNMGTNNLYGIGSIIGRNVKLIKPAFILKKNGKIEENKETIKSKLEIEIHNKDKAQAIKAVQGFSYLKKNKINLVCADKNSDFVLVDIQDMSTVDSLSYVELNGKNKLIKDDIVSNKFFCFKSDNFVSRPFSVNKDGLINWY
ncbi:MAG: transglutaminase-like domain-containing protein [Marinifilaceae bacterium]|jgi:hypothetical protein|nr:transglutaminase-like domain-containing protein [Marinifilaceae bacterium]